MLVFYALTRFFFFNTPATTEIYTLSLHDALPISADVNYNGVWAGLGLPISPFDVHKQEFHIAGEIGRDRKSTRLNSSHEWISYAVFCLKKKTHANARCSGTVYAIVDRPTAALKAT